MASSAAKNATAIATSPPPGDPDPWPAARLATRPPPALPWPRLDGCLVACPDPAPPPRGMGERPPSAGAAAGVGSKRTQP